MWAWQILVFVGLTPLVITFTWISYLQIRYWGLDAWWTVLTPQEDRISQRLVRMTTIGAFCIVAGLAGLAVGMLE